MLKKEEKNQKKKYKKEQQIKNKGITLIALVITTIFSYDEKLKYSNNNSFLLVTI